MKLPLFLCVLSFVFLSLRPASAAHPDAPGSLVLLLGVENVSKQLHLTSLQRAVLQSMRKEYRTAARGIVETNPDSPADRAAAENELEELTEAFNKRALSTLNPRQKEILGKIQHEILGGVMLTHPDVQKKLQLTERQKQRIAEMQARLDSRTAELNREAAEGRISAGERLAELRDLRLKQAAAMERVLSRSQREAFLNMRFPQTS